MSSTKEHERQLMDAYVCGYNNMEQCVLEHHDCEYHHGGGQYLYICEYMEPFNTWRQILYDEWLEAEWNHLTEDVDETKNDVAERYPLEPPSWCSNINHEWELDEPKRYQCNNCGNPNDDMRCINCGHLDSIVIEGAHLCTKCPARAEYMVTDAKRAYDDIACQLRKKSHNLDLSDPLVDYVKQAEDNRAAYCKKLYKDLVTKQKDALTKHIQDNRRRVAGDYIKIRSAIEAQIPE